MKPDKLIRPLLFLAALLMMAACHHAIPKSGAVVAPERKDSIVNDTPSPDTAMSAKIDTSTPDGQLRYIKAKFIEDGYGAYQYDTLIDLNYDGYPDYVIGLYGMAGNGIKNGVQVYLYDPKSKRYEESEQLSNMPNPTFYLREKKITTFYIAGSGSGSRLEWIKDKWTETKTFEVDHDDKDYLKAVVWTITYPLRGKKDTVMRPFEMIPPADILESSLSKDKEYTPFQ